MTIANSGNHEIDLPSVRPELVEGARPELVEGLRPFDGLRTDGLRPGVCITSRSTPTT